MESGHQWNTMLATAQVDGIRDYISNLPDPLLGHILSFIPTKSAVATSILSKRWKTVWTKIPKLDFSEMPHIGSCCILGPRERLFENFVSNVLSRNDMSSISILRLHFYNGLLPRVANFWLRDIVRRDIREIDLTCHCLSLKLPKTFFTKEKLVALKLTCFTLDVPDLLHWPCLEYLHVVCGFFPNVKSLKNLVSGSPTLKELAIDCCDGISTLSISCLSLKTLEIKNTLTGIENPVLIIEAPNLETLYLSDLADEYDFSNVSLDKAVITIHDRRLGHREKLAELLRGICHLKILKLGRVTTEVLHDILNSSLPSFHNIQLPSFNNLVYLEMTVGSWSIILQMLEFAPNLISLILYNYNYHGRTDWDSLSLVPKCLVLTLLEISIHYLTKEKGDMKMVEYLLQNAAVLKKLKFSMVPKSSSGGYTDVVELFREVRRASSQCEIVLCQS